MAAASYTLPTLPCALPTAILPEPIDFESIASVTQNLLSSIASNSFFLDAIWRDSFALTGTLRTFYSASSISSAWKEVSSIHDPSNFQIGPTTKFRAVKVAGGAWVEVPFVFETRGVLPTICSGFASIAQTSDGSWKIWVLRTILENIKGCPNVDELQPKEEMVNVDSNGHACGTNGHTNGNGSVSNGTTVKHYDCVVVGGGQAGLSTGGRLQALGISYVVLEKYQNVGDNWKLRYDSTKLHTIREFGHLPFDRTFPESYPQFLSKDHLAEGYQRWVKKYGINVILSTTLLSGSWDGETETWTLCINSNGSDSTITAANVVFAVGVGSQVPVKPTYTNEAHFKGVEMHSGEYKNSKSWKGKHGVIIGTANTAHDVADDMLEAGLTSVTMVQRTPTYVVPAEYYADTHVKAYNSQVPTEVADRMYFSGPAVLGRTMSQATLLERAAQEPERFEALERAGFQLDKQGDMFYYLFQRFGGHYMDVGTSKKISAGLIKMKSNALPVSWTEDGLLCDDGSNLRADVVVFATGFVCNLKLLVAELFGPELAASLDDLWGLDEEGEIRGAFKPCGHPAFWFHGGAVGQARYFARFIALQIKAKLMGTPLPLYEGTRRAVKLAVL